jgi:hypothetical protein
MPTTKSGVPLFEYIIDAAEPSLTVSWSSTGSAPCPNSAGLLENHWSR